MHRQAIIDDLYDRHFERAVEVGREVEHLRELLQSIEDQCTADRYQSLKRAIDELDKDMRALGRSLAKGRKTAYHAAA